jgi:hypothetical protein
MSVLTELNSLLTELKLPVETGIFSGIPPDEYAVITPLGDLFAVHADNRPHFEVQEARISLFSKGNYLTRSRQIVTVLLGADFTITERKYAGHENDTGYHNYAIDAAKEYSYTEGVD